MDGLHSAMPLQFGAPSDNPGSQASVPEPATSLPAAKKKSRRAAEAGSPKRRCISTACVACRRRKSKCNGALPSCAACASVYGTECIYDPNSDHRRKGVYKEKIDSMKARSSTLQILIEAVLNAPEEDVPDIVRKMRTCDSLDAMAESILNQENEENNEENGPRYDEDEDEVADMPVEGERELARKMGELRLENGSIRFIGGTSHLIYLGDPSAAPPPEPETDNFVTDQEPITSWSEVTKDPQLIIHLMNMYFTWHYPYFATLSKSMFYREFLKGKPRNEPNTTFYCSSLLVNAMLALGCHFSSAPGAFAIAGDSRTKGDHFFAEAKRLILENDEYEKPRLTTVQALALMSVREAGCAREAKGWVYSGMSFRMAQDIGLNLDVGGMTTDKGTMSEQETDARRITFWGCFLFDKCWSNYLGRLPQIPRNTYNVPKFDVFPDEDAEPWSAYTDNGFQEGSKQPSRTRAVALQLSKLCEISSDLLIFFYHPNHIGRSSGKAVELKKLSELHRRLEDWRQALPKELEPKEGQLPTVYLMLMFYQLQFLHLFRPFLKYAPSASPLPPHVSPRRICTAAAMAISKLMRSYKKAYNLRQICNIAVYMEHSACIIHLLNLPDKMARRDIIHGVKHLEEIAEDWLCARRSLSILSVLARKWKVDVPEEAWLTFSRCDEKWGTFNTWDVPSPSRQAAGSPAMSSPKSAPTSPPATKQEQYSPTNQFTHVSPAGLPPDLSTRDGSADLLSSLGMSMQNGMPSPVRNSPISMGEALAAANAWALPPVSPGAVPGFTSPIPPQQRQQHQQQQQQSQQPQQPQGPNTARQVSPTSLYAVDGQEWYLKDGVNWQQNFETWGLSPPPAPSASGSATGAAVPSGNNSSPSSSSGNPDASMYMFRGVGLSEMDATFDAFPTSMSSMDHLPGLE